MTDLEMADVRNAPSREGNEAPLLPLLLAERAARAPEAVAVAHGAETLAYGELDAWAGALAAALREAGVGPETPVGVCLERSAEGVAALLGVLRSGGALLPLDPAHPPARLAALLADAGARAVVTRAALRERLPAEIPAVLADGPLPAPPAGEGWAGPAIWPESAACVVYTSGSTGTPRGVVVTHAALAAHARAAAAAYALGPGDRVPRFASPAFDVALEEVLPTLLAGATVVIPDARAMGSLEGFLAFARERETTVWNLPSPYWHELVGALERAGGGVPPSLRLLVVGSDAASPAALAAWRRLAGEGVAFRNAYGPTEATVTATLYEPPAGGVPADAPSVPVGRPLPGVRAYVLDPRGEPVEDGAAGELYLGGAGVARGYLGRPAATAERFLPDPFAGAPGARAYRTGDRARWRGGALEFLGRADRQVKVRGFRVEPEEVEAALRAHPAVRDAAIVAREDAPGRVRLVGYAAADPGAVDEEALRAHLAGRLPAFLVPDALVLLPALPLNARGKVDRGALPAPAPRGAPAEPPREGAEARIAAVWEEVLRVDGVGRGEPFLALGGNSLLAAQVVSRVGHAFGVRLSVPALLEAGTVAGLADAVARAGGEGAVPPPRRRPGPREGDGPLSTSQERAWFLCRLHPASLAYQFQAALRFRGALDPDALERALAEMVRRHEVFRTSFPEAGGEPVARVHPPTPVRLPRDDLRGVPAHERRAEADRRIAAEMARPFDLGLAPLVRWRLLRLGGDAWELAHVEHHAVHDGWSFNVFLGELLELYRAFAAGLPSPLPEPALQFADYAAWQREWLEGPEAAAQLDFWKARLAGAPPLLELPTDRARPPEQRFRGGLLRMELSAEEAERLRALGRERGATLFMTMLAAFAVLMGRMSGQDDLPIGSGVANRRWREVEGTLGMFVNSVVLRLGLEDDPSFAALLERTRRTTLEAYARQDLPFDHVVRALTPERSLSHNPLHQVLFSFDDARMPEVEVPGVEVTVREGLANGSAKFDMNVIVAPRAPGSARFSDGWEAGGLTVLWEYDADLFDAATTEAAMRHFRALLASAVATPDAPVSRLRMTTEAERAALVAASPARACFPVRERIEARFARRAAERPDAVAVTFEDESLTYAELDARANRLAHRLRALGVGAETRVGVCLERSAELVVAILAVLKAGGAYVPVDPAYPAERIGFVLADSGARVLLARSPLPAGLPAHGARVVRLDAEAAEIAALPATAPEARGGTDAAAYVIYTSGSTGKPKGVEVTHANVVRLFDATDAWFGFGAEDVWTLFHSAAFDFSVWETWGALLYGGRLVVVPFLVTRSPEDFHRLLAREGVTVLNQTPSAFKQLVEADLASGVAPEAMRLRWIVFGGEALEPRSLLPWFSRHGDRRPRLVNMYGITETTVHVTYREIAREDAERGGSPIGVPLPDLAVYLLDAHGEPVPAGVPGEIHVGGAGVARGYLNRAQLSAERFVRDPFSDQPGARMYRSGDLARRRGDGELEYLGRADQQVKVRGFRIETGEVEAALLAHAELAQAAVVARDEAGGERRLVAYVVPRPGAPAPSPAALRGHLAARLPDYMVPAAFVPLAALPLTEHGKLDRRALPAPSPSLSGEGDAYRPPATPAEAALAAVWAEVLGTERVGTEDNYFALGGDSIRGVRLVARARAAGLAVSLPDLFRHQTIRALAAAATARGGGEGARPAAEVEDAYPLTPFQQGMLFQALLSPASGVNVQQLVCTLREGVDAERMERAWNALARRHGILRTRFRWADVAEPVQEVLASVRIEVARHDHEALAPEEREAALARWLAEDRGRGIALAEAPAMRLALFRRAEGEHVLVWTFHHAIMDGRSVATLLREVLARYDGADEAALPPPPRPFGEHARWLAGRDAAADRAFWSGRPRGEDGVAPVRGTRLAPRDPEAEPRSGSAVLLLSEEADAALRAFRGERGIPLNVLAQGAWALLLGRMTGSAEVLFGALRGGRAGGVEGAEEMVGPLLNTVPVRVRVPGGARVGDWLREMAEANAAMRPHEHAALADVVRWSGLPAGAPPFDTLFNYQPRSFEAAFPETGTRAFRMLRQPGHPLALTVSGAAPLRVQVEYDADRFDAAAAEALLERYRVLLEAMAAAPDALLASLSAPGPEAAGGGETGRRAVVRGFRVRMDEVEAALLAHPDLAGAAVAAREEGDGERRLVAYVVPRPGAAVPPAAGLRAHLAGRVHDAAVPSAFVALDALPLADDGTVDLHALAALHGAGEDAYAAPRTPAEAALAAAWAEVLGVERVGIDDGYLALGGDSIRSVRVVARARAAGVPLSLPDLFRHQTIRALAAAIATDGEDEAADGRDGRTRPFSLVSPETRRALPADVEDAYPLTLLQRGMLFHTAREPGSSLYQNVNGYRVKAPLDEAVLREALDRVGRRHPVLRTSFDLEARPEPVQRVHRGATVPLEVIDLSRLSAEEREGALDRWIAEERGRGFDWTRAPLLRFTAHRLDGETFQLSFSEHHAILDGWSVATLMTELLRVYAAIRAGVDDPTAAEAPRSLFRDYVAREREAAASPEQREFWTRALEGSEPTVLPRRAAPAEPGAEAFSLDVEVPERAWAGARRLAERAGVPLKSVLLAAHARVLGLLAGTTDVLGGLVVGGRLEDEDGARVLGLFLNTVPLRVALPGGTWAELARDAFRAEHAALPFRRYPLAEIQRVTGRRPLLDVAFNFNHFHVYRGAAGEGVEIVPDRFFQRTEFALVAAFSIGALDGRPALRLDCDPAAVGGDEARRIGAAYARALEEIAADPEGRYDAASLVGDEDRALLDAWNDTADGAPRGLCVHALFERQAARSPDAVAVVHGGERVTYGELNARANRLAHRLRALGVGPEARVAVCMERTPALVAALFAVLKAGGCYVPVDPEYPAERIAHLLADSRAAVLLVDGGLADRLPAHGSVVLSVDAEADALAAEPADHPAPLAGPGNLAYCIYTSGSTGRPKGVAIEHRSTVALLHWLRGHVTDEERGAVLASTSVSFDVSVAEIFGTLCWGGRIVLVRDALALAEVAEDDGPVLASMTPSAAAELLRLGALPPRLRRVNLGGEALPADLARRLYATGSVEHVGNYYGPTEDTTYSTSSRVEPGAERVAVGRPVANTRLHVLDPHLSPVPVGVPGELYVSGEGLARGYLDRAALTAERFVPDPFSPEPGGRMYRVGDRVRWLPRGELEFLGRLDDQVKVRGHRVELGEVEHALRAHPRVREAAAVVREDAPGDPRLVAYVVPEAEDESPSSAELREHLAATLPAWMVPAAFVVLDRLPLSPNGKTDRRALPAPGAERAQGEGAYAAPRTPLEEVLAGIWAEVLGREHVGTGDDFFALGGHSLLATQVVSRVRGALGVELPLRAVFEAPTVAALAARVEEARRGGGEAEPLPPLVPRPRADGVEAALPLSFAQERLWFLQRMAPETPFYNVPLAVALEGPIDAEVLRRALEEVAARHEALRTTFAEADGAPRAVVHPAGALLPAFAVDDLSALPPESREAEAARIADEEARRPFSLERGPLLRARLVRLAPERHLLVPVMHHAVGDGWSAGILFRELAALVDAFSRGAPSPLPPLPVQYADFAAWQRDPRCERALERQLAFWRERLAGAPPEIPLPTDRPRPPVQSFRGAAHRVSLPASLATAVREAGRREGATPFMVLLAAFAALLSRWTGETDLVVGSPIAGRTRAETEELIGFFVNTLALRTDLSGDPSFRELLARVRETTLEAYARQDLPFERLVDALRPERDTSRSPVFQVMFALQNAPPEADRLGGARATPRPAETGTSKVDLSLLLREDAAGLHATLEYATDLFDRATVERLAEHFRTLLEAAVAAPERRVADLPLLSAEERRRVVEAWNDTARAWEPAESVAALVARWARATPDAPAVVAGGVTLTCADLDAAAARIARALAARGVGPETRVALVLERGAALVTAMLGVLRAGGAYLPLDADTPPERLRWLLEDSGAAVVLTRAALLGRVPAAGPEALAVEETEAEDAGAPLPPDPAHPEGAAYVIYTSGSTGRPKGVVVTHRGLLNLVRWHADAFALTPADRATQVAQAGFDASGWEVWPYLVSGASVHVVEDEVRASPEALRDRLLRDRITLAFVPTPLAEPLLALPWPREAALRTLLTGGDRLRARPPAGLPFTLVNDYGPTEAAVVATSGPVAPAGAGAPSIGRPIANARAYVLDARLSPVPAGVPGELFVAGEGVARGYLGRPGMTAERFVPDPFSALPGARMYRTGDRVRWLADGEVDFLGRIDHQVKLRGFRIEPGEIEHALREDPRLADAVVVPRDGAGGARLVAYVVPAAGRDAPSRAEARAWLRERLPAYMLPDEVVTLRALPLTPSGKTDRAALPAPPPRAPAAAAPASPLEGEIARAWEEVLGVEGIGPGENFFDLGANSLLVARAHARLRHHGLTLVDLFTYPSVRELAGFVAGRTRDAEELEGARLRAGKRRGAARGWRANG